MRLKAHNHYLHITQPQHIHTVHSVKTVRYKEEIEWENNVHFLVGQERVE